MFSPYCNRYAPQFPSLSEAFSERLRHSCEESRQVEETYPYTKLYIETYLQSKRLFQTCNRSVEERHLQLI